MNELTAGEIKRLELLNNNIAAKLLKPHQLMKYVKDFLALSLVNVISSNGVINHNDRINLVLNWYRQHGNIRTFRQCVEWCTPALSKNYELHPNFTIHTGVTSKLKGTYGTSSYTYAYVLINANLVENINKPSSVVCNLVKEIITSKDSKFEVELIRLFSGFEEEISVDEEVVCYSYKSPPIVDNKLNPKDVSDFYARVFIWCLYHNL